MSNPLKSQRGVVDLLLVLILVGVVAAIGAYAYTKSQNAQYDKLSFDNLAVNKPDAKPTEKKSSEGAPQPTVVSEATFSITLPVGWEKTGKVDLENTAHDGTMHYYQDKSGNYFVVGVDPGGRGLNADVSWTLKVLTDRVSIEQEGTKCVQDNEGFCAAGNNILELFMNLGGTQLKGHHYYFQAGNNKREDGVDLQPFRDLVLSIRAK